MRYQTITDYDFFCVAIETPISGFLLAVLVHNTTMLAAFNIDGQIDL